MTTSPRTIAVVSPSAISAGSPSTPKTGLVGSVGIVVVVVVEVVDDVVVEPLTDATALCGRVVVTAGAGVGSPSVPDGVGVAGVTGVAITLIDCDAAAAEYVSLPD